MLTLSVDIGWLELHANRQPDGTWRCKETGAVIEYQSMPHHIWIRPDGSGFMNFGGFGMIRDVSHLYCPACNPERVEKLEPGQAVYEDEFLPTVP